MMIPCPILTNPIPPSTNSLVPHNPVSDEVGEEIYSSSDSGDDSEHEDEYVLTNQVLPPEPQSVTTYIPLTSEGGADPIQGVSETPIPLQPDQTTTISISSNLLPLHHSAAVATPNSSNPVSFPDPLSDPIPLHKQDKQLPENDDGMVSDSGDESEHCPENFEVSEIAPQGEELVEFITKQLEIVRKVIEDAEARNLPSSLKQNQANEEGQFVNNDQDLRTAVSEEGHRVKNKEKRKIVTRSARRRKRGALLLQSEEM